jgi:hypothetical protein
MGFSVPPRLRLERWALTPPFHPYHALPQTALDFVTGCPHPSHLSCRPGAPTRCIVLAASGRAWRYILCGTFRRDASRHRLPRVSPAKPELRGIAPCSVRTFLPPGSRRKSDPPPFQNQPKYSHLFNEGKFPSRWRWAKKDVAVCLLTERRRPGVRSRSCCLGRSIRGRLCPPFARLIYGRRRGRCLCLHIFRPGECAGRARRGGPDVRA